jgi:hypothetical protein
MFFVEGDRLKLAANRMTVCPLSEIQRAITELETIRDSPPAPYGNEWIDERYTAEGINRRFQAAEHYTADPAQWKRDAENYWHGIEGPELFRRYQKHAEFYCEGCASVNREPTYEGFRDFLIEMVMIAKHTNLY